MAKKTVVIKKYENRRLYDTTNSRYVNLEEAAQLLQQGNDVQMVDATTNEDITRLILTQIIVEDAKAPNSTFPVDLLRQMVITSGRANACFQTFCPRNRLSACTVQPTKWISRDGLGSGEKQVLWVSLMAEVLVTTPIGFFRVVRFDCQATQDDVMTISPRRPLRESSGGA